MSAVHRWRFSLDVLGFCLPSLTSSLFAGLVVVQLPTLGWDEEKDASLVEGLARNAGHVTHKATFTQKLHFFEALLPFAACTQVPLTTCNPGAEEKKG